MKSKDYMESNRHLWNEMTPIHVKSDMYAVDEFRKGKNSLHSIEMEELEDVSGKTMLHLQCHFGQDTLSWARLGAKVTGVDFSDDAIVYAKKLSSEIGIKAEFILCNIYELDQKLKGKYDIVFTSYGVLPWLPDLKEWARIIGHFLKPGGIFYIVESHPFGNTFADDDVQDLEVYYSYFQSPQPMHFPPEPTYADRNSKLKNPSYEWFHTISDIMNSLIANGLSIQFLHEFPFSVYQCLPFLEKGDDGWWYLPDSRKDVPFMFSLMAKKEATNY